jgi:hypothetical protein
VVRSPGDRTGYVPRLFGVAAFVALGVCLLIS